jgi:hypothetical protein
MAREFHAIRESNSNLGTQHRLRRRQDTTLKALRVPGFQECNVGRFHFVDFLPSVFTQHPTWAMRRRARLIRSLHACKPEPATRKGLLGRWDLTQDSHV